MLVSICLFLAGVINLLPVVGLLSTQRLEGLYGITLNDPNILVLMRHRAVLFGLLGAGMVAAAFVHALQPAAMLAGGISMLSFALIAHAHSPLNDTLKRVLAADWIGLVLLTIAVFTKVLS